MGMSLRFMLLVWLALLMTSQGCSFNSELASASTDSMGDWSPVGSRQVSRHTRFTLATQYRLAVATLTTNRESAMDSLDSGFSQALVHQLQRHYLVVDELAPVASMDAALSSARNSGADILLVAKVQRWPDIDPVRLHECAQAGGETQIGITPCDKKDKHTQGEMALKVALYDVRDGRSVDAISARSRRGMSAFVYEDAVAELEQLCKMIVGQLSPQR